jgi:hypothetical protein
MFLLLGGGNFMARTSQQYAKEGYAENVTTYAGIGSAKFTRVIPAAG